MTLKMAKKWSRMVQKLSTNGLQMGYEMDINWS